MNASIKSLPLQIAESIISEIRSSQMAPGEKLPPLRQLAKKYNISYVTAQRALKILQDRQFVDSRSGGGSYVSDNIFVPAADGELKLNRHDREKKIGILLPSWATVGNGASVYEIIDGFTEICTANNWIVELINSTPESINSIELVRKIYQKNFDGLVWLTPIAMHKWILDELSHRVSCLVVSERPFENIGINTVHMDYDDLGRKIVKLFAERGHRNIAMFTGQYDGIWSDTHTTIILDAVRKAAKAAGMAFDKKCYCQTHPLPAWEAGAVVRQYFQENKDRNAIICLHNEHLKSIVEEARKLTADPASEMTIIDTCYQSNPFYVDKIGEIDIFRVKRPNRNVGITIGNIFEKNWLNKEITESPELKSEIIPPGEML